MEFRMFIIRMDLLSNQKKRCSVVLDQLKDPGYQGIKKFGPSLFRGLMSTNRD